VAGLPLVFAEKVKENLQIEYPDTTLKDLTYGRISAMVKNTGVALCNAMKIENRIKKNQQLGIKELGDFCTQYGYERITPPSTSKRKIIKKNQRIPPKRNWNLKKKSSNKTAETQPPKQNHNPPPQDKSKIICYKCGRFGHYKRDCKMKEKINNLNMNDELKEQIAKIFLESSDEEEEEVGEIIENSDEEIEECGETDCDENCSCRYQVNVISSETKRALEMIDLIENPKEKFKWLTKIKSEILEEKEEN